MSIGHIVYSSVNRGTSYVNSIGAVYAILNGQSLPREAYPELSTYWPDGSFGSDVNNIHLPNIQDLYWRGADLGRGADETVGSRTSVSGTLPSGTLLGSYQGAEMPSHVHVSGTIPVSSQSTNFAQSSSPSPNCPRGPFVTVQADLPTQVYFHPDSQQCVTAPSQSSNFEVGNVSYFPYICVAV